jgi:hypothetical protein
MAASDQICQLDTTTLPKPARGHQRLTNQRR